MFVGSSVSRKEFDEVFPNCHICSLDCQCRGKNLTKFSRIAIYICSLDRQCHGNNVSPYTVWLLTINALLVLPSCTDY